MTAVAVAAIASLAAAKVCRDFPYPDQRGAILVASVVAGAAGVVAVRRPWAMFALPFVIWVAMPTVDHPGVDVLYLSARGCFLGWIIGAPAGWISRLLTRPRSSLPVVSRPRGPEASSPQEGRCPRRSAPDAGSRRRGD
jgi:hypothetical protein